MISPLILGKLTYAGIIFYANVNKNLHDNDINTHISPGLALAVNSQLSIIHCYAISHQPKKIEWCCS